MKKIRSPGKAFPETHFFSGFFAKIFNPIPFLKGYDVYENVPPFF